MAKLAVSAARAQLYVAGWSNLAQQQGEALRTLKPAFRLGIYLATALGNNNFHFNTDLEMNLVIMSFWW